MRKEFPRSLLLIIFLACLHLTLWAQNKTVKGKVTDAKGLPVAGASVQVKGTSIGTTTSTDGTFTLTVPADAASLVISGVGYADQTVAITAQPLVVQLADATANLNEVVVIGYGTQRKGDLTAPVTSVNTDDMLKRTTATPMDALQGSVAGVQVVSNGAPGSSPNVRIRGVGSFSNSNPLYVVDGMFVNDISFLNTNDIAEMSVLKDASGAAIYGVRAANGVVLITTKKGRLNMKTRITYNGYTGFQMPTNILKMANGQQSANYALQWKTTQDSNTVKSSVSRYGGSGLNPTTSTDWYKELLRDKALITNHSIDIQGGGDKVSYTVGGNYTYQNGIMEFKNDYRRYNVRFQMEAKVLPWLKVGLTSLYNNSITYIPNNNALLGAYMASPLFPVYDPKNVNAFPVKFATGEIIGKKDDGNPVATAYYNNNRYKQFQILPSAYAEASFWMNKLTFHTQISQLYSSGLATNYSPRRFLGPGTAPTNLQSHLVSAQDRNTNYILDNLLNYKDSKGAHHWSVLVGQSAREERWRYTKVEADGVPPEEEFWYTRQGTTSANYYDEDGFRGAGLSFFTRGTYDYDNKYLLTATWRADGSSKYQTKWGYFPSVGLGWVVSREHFMDNQKIFDFLKLRGSWGKLGNDAVLANAGYAIATGGLGNSSIFGSTSGANGQYEPGYTVNRFFSNVSWEVVTEWDGGIDFEMLSRRLKGSVDYYHRTTKGAALSRPFAFGVPDVYGNWADMENSGFDIALSWNDKIGKLSYQIGANISTLKNNVTNIGNSLDNIMGGYPEWMAEFPSRIKVGQPINYFYGLEMIGVYQTADEVAKDPMAVAYNKNLTSDAAKVQPGFLKFKDQNGNGILDEGDRINMGSNLPKVTYGFNLALQYSNFDFSIAVQGVSGSKILNLNRGRFVKAQSSINIDAELADNLWTGAGSTNSYPSAFAFSQAWNRPSNSFFVESGSYLRVQNIQLGYSFSVNKKSPIGLRVFATADRPFIFTGYSGFTPEISSGSNNIGDKRAVAVNNGYDANVYPVSATYSLGVRATF
ncbi:TonB-dependent receptor [Pseudoflavitalea sp. G-6-1-2]|uniref:SusC/RagA family TonB-linked outer membrane protein n=1 Tax=Pseudoflavitalea sp. G-6-1-2 TaxID=2728841 RepID=UPI001469EC04|nr:TonB-dependent receptor [Pseudoflavitalea sp. G-6-1-2]NML21178.1 TonB-dependent receptor [Pseudoflavitalea sp. G-6-1-2]